MLKINGNVLFCFPILIFCLFAAVFMWACSDNDGSGGCDYEEWDSCEEECDEQIEPTENLPASYECYYQCVPDSCEPTCQGKCIHDDCTFFSTLDEWHDCADLCVEKCEDEY